MQHDEFSRATIIFTGLTVEILNNKASLKRQP